MYLEFDLSVDKVLCILGLLPSNSLNSSGGSTGGQGVHGPSEIFSSLLLAPHFTRKVLKFEL